MIISVSAYNCVFLNDQKIFLILILNLNIYVSEAFLTVFKQMQFFDFYYFFTNLRSKCSVL